MDPVQPHPPIDIVLYIFTAFTRVYYTSNRPIDFIQHRDRESTQLHFKTHSLQARQALFNLYTLFQPLVVANPIHQQMLESAFLYAIQLIHTKFGTVQLNAPFTYPTI